MKCLVLYAYPPEPDGQSLQGHLLYKGILNANEQAMPCHFKESIQKEFYLKHIKPDVSYGIGFWGNVPDIVQAPMKHGVTPVPWFNSDGWVANYQKEFNELKLMFTTSNWVKSVYKRDGIDVDKIVPMHIGVDTDEFYPKKDERLRKAVRDMIGVEEKEKMILTVGGDVTSKGAQEMIQALAKINEEFKDWKYVCKSWPSECADGWRDTEIQLADELGIGEKIIFIDDEFSPEFMADLLNASDVYAAPSRLEGYGMVQVEAMACGKPVISIDKMGPGETIIHGKTGFLAKVAQEIQLKSEWIYPWMGFKEKKKIKFDTPKTLAYRADIEDLRKYTLQLLTDEKLREKMGKQARKHVLDNLEYRNIARQIVDITKDRLDLK